MSRFAKGLLGFAVLSTLSLSALVGAYAETDAEIQQMSQNTLQTFEKKVPKGASIVSQAKGVLVFPKVYSGALVVGADHGHGELLVDGQHKGFYNLNALSAGLEAGGKSQSLVIIFKNQAALDKLLQHDRGWDIGTDASVVAAEKGTNTLTMSKPKNAILIYGLDQKGLMGSLSLKGMRISKRKSK